MTENESEYLEKVLHSVLEAIVLAGAPKGETAGGYIDLPIAHEALIMAMGVLAVQSGNFSTPSEMRRLSERMAKKLLNTMQSLSSAKGAEGTSTWKMERIGPTH